MNSLLVIIVVLSLYFLPSLIGMKKHNIWAIFILNLLLGWTLIGWVVAIVWATTKDTVLTESIDKIDQLENKNCPDCAEIIKYAAKVCKHCGMRFETDG